MKDQYPKEIDYTSMPVGKRTRARKGKVSQCPSCKKNGLRLVYSWCRGRYQVSYHHLAVQPAPGEAPIAKEICSLNSHTLRGLPLSERSKGRE